MLPLDPPKLYPRYVEAKRQNLSIFGEDGIYFVSSFRTKPGEFHKVVIEGDRGSCSCPAKLHCTHLALAASEHSLSLWRAFFNAGCEAYAEKRADAQRKAWGQVTKRQKRRAWIAAERLRRAKELSEKIAA